MESVTKPIPTDMETLIKRLQNKPLEEILTRLVTHAENQREEIRLLKEQVSSPIGPLGW